MTAEPLRPVRRFVLVAIVLPIAVTLLAVVVQLLLLPRLPELVASHWGPSGVADGFTPPWLTPLLTAVLGSVLPLLLAGAALPALRRGHDGASARLVGAMSAGIAVLLATLLTWTIIIQLDVADPSIVTLPFWPDMVTVFAIAVAAGLGAWLVLPRGDAHPRPTAPAPTLALAAGERAVWMRSVSIARAGLIVVVLADIVVSALAVGSWVVGASAAGAWLLSAVALLLVVLTATSVAFHVRVDDTGLTVQSVLGLPRVRVALDDIESVAVIDAQPMAEFGGWGIRLAVDGRFGVVLRAGEAIAITRRGARPFVVTVDDADTGAALLRAFSARVPPPAA